MFAAFNFISCQPCGRLFAVAVLLFCLTAEAKMPAACDVSHAAGDIFPHRIHTGGDRVIELAGIRRGADAGTSLSTPCQLARPSAFSVGADFFSYTKCNKGRPVVLAPDAAMAVSAAYNPELCRA